MPSGTVSSSRLRGCTSRVTDWPALRSSGARLAATRGSGSASPAAPHQRGSVIQRVEHLARRRRRTGRAARCWRVRRVTSRRLRPVATLRRLTIRAPAPALAGLSGPRPRMPPSTFPPAPRRTPAGQRQPGNRPSSAAQTSAQRRLDRQRSARADSACMSAGDFMKTLFKLTAPDYKCTNCTFQGNVNVCL